MNFSLIITTYNSLNSLLLVLRSVEAQTIFPYEVVIADDGSLPDTMSIIKKFEVVFPNKITVAPSPA